MNNKMLLIAAHFATHTHTLQSSAKKKTKRRSSGASEPNQAWSLRRHFAKKGKEKRKSKKSVH